MPAAGRIRDLRRRNPSCGCQQHHSRQNQADLGVNTIWLLPFYPSPFKDDGYDISDYRGVHPDYGTLRDFRQFIREAHAGDCG
jgi:1,4-alpha-glucan branching enzyme